MKKLFLTAVLTVVLAVPCHAKSVPILMYHDFSNTYTGDFVISESLFREHLAALSDAGYQTVSFADLIDYVYYDGDLPDNPIIITSDDGYTSVIDIAVPAAEEFGMKLTCAVIGNCVNKEGHFSLNDTIPTSLEIVSHTYGLHDIDNGWNGILNSYLDCATYETSLVNDCQLMKQSFAEQYPYTSSVLIYPHGAYSEESERILHNIGYLVTVACDRGVAEIKQNKSATLYKLPRISVWNTTTPEALLYWIEYYKTHKIT